MKNTVKWIESITRGADKVLSFLNNLTDIEKLLSGLRKGTAAFTEELKKKEDKK